MCPKAHHVGGVARETPKDAAARRRPHVRIRVAAELVHARLVAEDGPAGHVRAGVDGEHRHLQPRLRQHAPQRLDQCTLASPWRPCDAHADRRLHRARASVVAAARPRDVFEERLCLQPMCLVGRLDKRDGARKGLPIARQELRRQAARRGAHRHGHSDELCS